MTNIEASVRAQLHNLAKKSGRPLQEYLQHYGLERFLFRLSNSKHANKFILKGGLMFRVWRTASGRPTKDIDLHGFSATSIADLEEVVRDVCSLVNNDGIRFDVASIAGETIKEGADYEGVRVRFLGLLGNARIMMQLDIAFGDVIYPEAIEVDYPTLLNQEAPRLRVYPRETVISEKFQAMVQLGASNSRMKDFYDIWLLSQKFDFSGNVLQRAMQKTFENRKTEMEAHPLALTAKFSKSAMPATQWAAFHRRSKIEGCPEELSSVVQGLQAFLCPLAESIVDGNSFSPHWQPGGPWQ